MRVEKFTKMPLPTDPKRLALAEDAIQKLDDLFGLHPGCRPAHAKGVFLDGYDDAGSRERGTKALMDALEASLRA